MNRSLIVKAVDKYIKCIEENDIEKAKGWIIFCCKADLCYNKIHKIEERGTEEILLERASEYEKNNLPNIANKLLEQAETLSKIYNELEKRN